jgi:hypothetical protein
MTSTPFSSQKPLFFIMPSLTTLFIFFTLAAAVQAQEKTCRILFLGAPANAPESLFLFDGQECQEVRLPRMSFSPVYSLPKETSSIALLPKEIASVDELPTGAPSQQLSENLTDCYLLISSDPDNKVAPVKIEVIDASNNRLQTGEILWFNLTAHAVGGRVGTEALRLRPRKSLILDSPATSKEQYPVKLAYQMPDDENLYPLCETSWLHDPRSRLVAFVFTEDGRRTPRVLAFKDYRAPKKTEAP